MFVPLSFSDLPCNAPFHSSPSGLNLFKLRLLPLQISVYLFYLILYKFEHSTCRELSLSLILSSFPFSQVFSCSVASHYRFIGGSGLTGGLVCTVRTSFRPPKDKCQFLGLQFEPFTPLIVLIVCKHRFNPLVPINARIY